MLPSQHYRQPEAGAVLTALHDINTRHGYLPPMKCATPPAIWPCH